MFLLPLPSGQVLVLTPPCSICGAALHPARQAAGRLGADDHAPCRPPSIARPDLHVTGTQFNGLSEAAAYGDELTSATNYPLVRLTNTATGHVFYARTHDHSSMGVATGALPVTTSFDVPAAAETGGDQLVVIANGIASAAVVVTIG